MNWLAHECRRIRVERSTPIATQSVDDVRARHHAQGDASAVAYDDERCDGVCKDPGDVPDWSVQVEHRQPPLRILDDVLNQVHGRISIRVGSPGQPVVSPTNPASSNSAL